MNVNEEIESMERFFRQLFSKVKFEDVLNVILLPELDRSEELRENYYHYVIDAKIINSIFDCNFVILGFTTKRAIKL